MSGVRMAWDGFRVMTPERSWGLALKLVAPPIRRFSDVRVWGRERLPRTGPVILAANHQSFYDVFVLGAVMQRPIHYMAKQELFDNAMLGRMLPHTGAFPVRRGEADRGAIDAAREVLQRGDVLGIFIDGTRRHGEGLGEVRAGAAMIAGMTGAPIVPVWIHGTDRVVDAPRTPVSVTFGRPLAVTGRGGKAYREASETIGAYLRQLQSFAESAERAGRPVDAVPPEPPSAEGAA
ncbi:MAG: lysophospholipid acyltransferase family protein [Gaiellales bacterium]